MANRIDLFANALDGWLAEWKEKRQAAQVSCGTVEGHGVALHRDNRKTGAENAEGVMTQNANATNYGSGYQAPPAGIHLVNPTQQAQEMVNLDDLGITLSEIRKWPEYIPDPRDEEPWSDTQTRIEQMNSIKGR